MSLFKRGTPLSVWLLSAASVSLLVAIIRNSPTPEPPAFGDLRSRLLIRQPNASESLPETSVWNPVTLFQEIDRRFALLSPGRAVFSVPREMRVGDAKTVAFRVARFGDEKELLKGLPSGVIAQWQQAHITPTMKARISGADFDVKSESSEEQVVGGGGYTQWVWLVTPQASGDKELTLNVVAVVSVSGYEKPRDLLVTSRKVRVRVNPRLWLIAFVEAHWSNALSVVIGAMAVTCYQWVRRKLGTRGKGGAAGFV